MQQLPRRIALLALSGLSVLTTCVGTERSGRSRSSIPEADGHLFTRLPEDYTGVRFENRLQPTNDFNVFTYRNFYNGGGVALADLTGDGLPEIVLTSNQAGPRVFLNEGQFRFRDVTKRSGIRFKGTGAWATGVTVADVNGDGLLDVYICYAGPGAPRQRANELWINQGTSTDSVPHFREMARDYGVADEGYSTQAVFFDYDRDGQLDLFVINNSPRAVTSFGAENTRTVRDQYGGHKLYHRVGNQFVDVTHTAGIYESEMGFGLGLVASDLNGDGWPDLYVANDFFETDYLYLNNRDGTFTDVSARALPAMSYASMGLDAADVNNDGRSDIYTTDMLPEDELRLKLTTTFELHDQHAARVAHGFNQQFTRNMLQLNNGNGTFGDVGQMAGVARTDWSWGALIVDLDLDGWKDIFVTNGIAKDVTQQDYLEYLAQQRAQQQRSSRKPDYIQLVDATTSTKLPNYALHAHGDTSFSNESAAWGLSTPSFSSGAAYGDIDGDGAPDLVVNNVDDAAFIYRNNARASATRGGSLPQKANRFLQIRLQGDGSNRYAVGAKVIVHAGGAMQRQELSPTRGFQSSVDYVLTFGLGQRDTVDSVVVEWPDSRSTTLRSVAANQRITVDQAGATAGAVDGAAAPTNAVVPLLADVTDSIRLPFTHHENVFVDFDREPLMPKLLSLEGPALAVADVNGDGLDDLFIGGAKGQAGKLMIQERVGGGHFAAASEAVFAADSESEDVGATFVDANGDGRPDLYVVSGGNEFGVGSGPLQDRLYLNAGGGSFRKSDGALPVEHESGSVAAAGDFDGDGHADLFVGGRVAPWRYGVDPASMLLRGDGRGHFVDVTDRVAPQLRHVGMVTDAAWRDLDGDGRPELIVVGEWMPITVFHNTGRSLERATARGLEHSSGWWNRIVTGDFDGDGRADLVVGNAGLNTRLHASEAEPLTMYVGDFAHTGFVQQVLCEYVQGVSYPMALRDELLEAIPSLQTRFPSYESYARQSCAGLLSPGDLSAAIVRKAEMLASVYAHNDGNGSFTIEPLPKAAQLAPVYGLLATDADGDGKADLLLAGNFDGVKPDIGRMAASYGLLLHGDGRGHFTPRDPATSGFFVPGQSRFIQRVRTGCPAGAARPGGCALYVVARNNDRPLAFRRAGGPSSPANH